MILSLPGGWCTKQEERKNLDIPPCPKVQGFLNASLGCATEIVLSSLDVRLKSPNALWRLSKFYHNSRKAVLLGRGLYPIIFGQSEILSFNVTSPEAGSVHNLLVPF
ncbi:hypothetical protein NIES4106_32630 [Fischerella sp. NIES-4106]|nr:hypothetical protein NIES4106_32630 [Fischerella sp. NIES-4106]